MEGSERGLNSPASFATIGKQIVVVAEGRAAKKPRERERERESDISPNDCENLGPLRILLSVVNAAKKLRL